MSVWSVPSKSLRKKFPWLPRTSALSDVAVVRSSAYVFLVGYLILTIVSYYFTLQPRSLHLTIEMCGDTPCVTYVVPASLEWDQGVRPGMAVRSIDGLSLDGLDSRDFDTQGAEQIVFSDASGQELIFEWRKTAFVQTPVKVSLWTLGAVFALLGTAVVLRRPDLKAAQMFGIFAGATAIALTLGPDPQPAWSLVILNIALLPVGILCLLFVASLVEYRSRFFNTFAMPGSIGIGFILLVAYLFALLVEPLTYEIIRPFHLLYDAIPIILAVGLLAIEGSRQKSQELRQQSRIALAGIAFGTFPFVGITLIPEALGLRSLIPVQFAVVAVGILPAFFAYAILQHQLLGIRRLVHRGMVYVIASISLVTITSFVLSVTFSLLAEDSVEEFLVPVVFAILVAGVVFYPLSAITRRVVDRLIYGDVPDYSKLIDAVRADLLAPGQTNEVAVSMAKMLVNLLKLESVLIYLGESPQDAELVAAQGSGASEVQKKIYPGLRSDIERSTEQALIEIRWQSDSLLLATLMLPGTYFGYMLLGPRHGGEIFLQEEKALILNMVPVLALAIDKSVQSQQLRGLNQQLTKAGERERGHIASDIHDGPLQKAILLAGVGNGKIQDPAVVAKELASELREICSRLRPAILDDLGAVSALEWLLDETEKRHKISTELSLFNLDEDERFTPDEELVIFRVTQESINNAIKHAAANSLMVLLEKEENTLVLEISDDGKGFTPQFKSDGDGGFGITGMRERVVQVSGSLDIRSTPGVGTTVTARIPLEFDLEEDAFDDLNTESIISR